MFERFTEDARDVVRGATEHCERSGPQSVDAEHIRLALLDREASRGSFALAALGLGDRGEAVRTFSNRPCGPLSLAVTVTSATNTSSSPSLSVRVSPPRSSPTMA